MSRVSTNHHPEGSARICPNCKRANPTHSFDRHEFHTAMGEPSLHLPFSRLEHVQAKDPN